jgi:hypothetical protein
MQETFTRTTDAKAPLHELDIYELRLFDESNEFGTRYCVKQSHAEWSEIDGQIMWDQEEVEHFWVIAEAKKRYEERRVALAELGYIYSDMDW